MSQGIPKARPSAATPLLRTEPRYEVVPLPGVLDAVRDLPAGAVVTVTASPRRGADATIELTEQLAACGLRPVPHLAARQLRDEVELADAVARLDRAGVRDIFVVGGDSAEPAGTFGDGLALLRALDAAGHPFERIGVPAYPEGHPLIDDETLWDVLAAKQRYATYAVTQLCFDADAVCRFVATARRRGITVPVFAGVPGVVDTGRLLRMSLRVGVGDSVRFVRANRSVVTRLLNPRGYRPDTLVHRLTALARDGRCDLAGLHIYTFNHIAATVRWLDHARRRTAAA